MPLGQTSSEHHRGIESLLPRRVSFLVEGDLFQLAPHKFISESELFAQYYFPGALEPGCNASSSTHKLDAEHPIVLDGVRKDDFVQFLRVMSPNEHSAGPVPVLSTDEWIAVLKLSTLWGFDLIRTKAIQHISSAVTDPMRRIQLADHYGIVEWLLPAIDALRAKGTPLSPSELANMDLDYALKLVNTRRDFFTDQCACDWEFRSYVAPAVPECPPESRSAPGWREEYTLGERLESVWFQLRHGRTLRRRKTH